MNVPGYEILDEIGRGGMGIVHRARQVHLDRIVALKMILDPARVESLARFRLEAQAIARLDHPNIIRVYDFGEHDGRPYFSMEFIDGGSLQDRLSKTPWPAEAAAFLVRTLAGALHHAHERHIVHRDLKPSNVLLKGNGTPKISDFGLAKLLDKDLELTASGSILGSAPFMSPEQASGRIDRIGPATDIHALGAILYRLITGQLPFQGLTALATLEQVRMLRPVPPAKVVPELPAELDRICNCCLEKDPVRRYGTADELAADLQRFLDRLEPSPSPEPARAPPGRDEWWRL